MLLSLPLTLRILQSVHLCEQRGQQPQPGIRAARAALVTTLLPARMTAPLGNSRASQLPVGLPANPGQPSRQIAAKHHAASRPAPKQ
jgi:hypothetical protein